MQTWSPCGERRQPLDVDAEQPGERLGLGLAELRELRGRRAAPGSAPGTAGLRRTTTPARVPRPGRGHGCWRRSRRRSAPRRARRRGRAGRARPRRRPGGTGPRRWRGVRWRTAGRRPARRRRTGSRSASAARSSYPVARAACPASDRTNSLAGRPRPRGPRRGPPGLRPGPRRAGRRGDGGRRPSVRPRAVASSAAVIGPDSSTARQTRSCVRASAVRASAVRDSLSTATTGASARPFGRRSSNFMTLFLPNSPNGQTLRSAPGRSGPCGAGPRGRSVESTRRHGCRVGRRCRDHAVSRPAVMTWVRRTFAGALHHLFPPPGTPHQPGCRIPDPPPRPGTLSVCIHRRDRDSGCTR